MPKNDCFLLNIKVIANQHHYLVTSSHIDGNAQLKYEITR